MVSKWMWAWGQLGVVYAWRVCVGDVDVDDVNGFALGMWIVELCGVRDGHSYVEGFEEDDVIVMLQYLCSA